MRIFFPLLNLNKSGGIRIALQYCEGLANLGHEVFLVIPYESVDYQFEISSNITINRIQLNKYLVKFSKTVAIILAFRNIIEKKDILFCVCWQSILISSLNFHPFKKTFLLIQHDDDIILGKIQSISNLIKRIIFRIIYKLPINKLTVSNWLKVHLLEKYNVRTKSISNGVDVEKFYGSKPEKWTYNNHEHKILCLARSAEWKGFKDFIQACEIIFQTNSNISLKIVSQDELIFTTNIPFKIFRPKNDIELGSIYRDSSIFVFSSWIEGFGLPPLEAMANGLPVITTNCGGVDDFAINEYNCLMTPIKSPVKLANAILRLLHDENLQNKLSQNGILTSNKFTKNNTINILNEEILFNLSNK